MPAGEFDADIGRDPGNHDSIAPERFQPDIERSIDEERRLIFFKHNMIWRWLHAVEILDVFHVRVASAASIGTDG